MATGGKLDDFVDANFDLLADQDDFSEITLDENITTEEKEEVNDIIQAVPPVEHDENRDSTEDFEEEGAIARHANCSEKEIDSYAEEKYRKKTKEQTKWAVNVMKGSSLKFL